jgi:hypothetical protein
MTAGAAALLASALLASRLPFALGFPVVAASAAVWIAVVSHYLHSLSTGTMLATIGDNLHSATRGLATRVGGYDFRGDYQEALRKIRSEVAFKPLAGPTDIYPF